VLAKDEQQVTSLLQSELVVPVAVELLVVVFVAVAVELLVVVAVVVPPVHTGSVHFAPVVHVSSFVRLALQAAPVALVNRTATQFCSQVSAVASHGHLSSQFMKSAHVPPVKSPLA
jgi:hypothetical protein